MRLLSITFLLSIGCFISTVSGQIAPSDMDQVILFAENQAMAVSEQIVSTQFPTETDANGQWKTANAGNWVSGFWPGCLWYLYELTGRDEWRRKAELWTSRMESQKNNASNHDVGFRMMSCYGNKIRLHPASKDTAVLLTSANTLATRYHASVGCIRSWDWGSWNYPVIIDNMMNLYLLLWSAQNGGPQSHYDIAVKHADKTLAFHIRENGSTYHVIDFNNNGTLKKRDTHQGYTPETTWSRGQAWAVYGFTELYRETGESRFLDIAVQTADYFMNHLPDDFVPYSDFDSPKIPDESKDVSAAVIAASAFFELSELAGHHAYHQTAIDILNSVIANYTSQGFTEASILRRACTRAGAEEKGLIYADYYFLEALVRYNQRLTSIEPPVKNGAVDFRLLQNYPNPFNPSTRIVFTLNQNTDVDLHILNSCGQRIKTLIHRPMPAGMHQIVWDGTDARNQPVCSGVYLYRLVTEDKMSYRRLLLLK